MKNRDIVGWMGLGLASLVLSPLPWRGVGQTAPRPTFDVATIKPGVVDRQNGCFMRAQPGGQTFVGKCVTLRTLITYTYKITNDQVIGGPDWINADLWDFQAKTGRTLHREEFAALFESLLIDKFQLKIHRETRTMPRLELTVDKGGLKMTQSTSTDEFAIPVTLAGGGTPPQPPKWKGTRVPMQYLAWWLSQQQSRPIADHTGLTGFWDFTLEYAPDVRLRDANGNDAPGFEGPSFVTALRDQMGLRVESNTGPVEVIVIDRVERPTNN